MNTLEMNKFKNKIIFFHSSLLVYFWLSMTLTDSLCPTFLTITKKTRNGLLDGHVSGVFLDTKKKECSFPVRKKSLIFVDFWLIFTITTMWGFLKTDFSPTTYFTKKMKKSEIRYLNRYQDAQKKTFFLKMWTVQGERF